MNVIALRKKTEGNKFFTLVDSFLILAFVLSFLSKSFCRFFPIKS